MPHTLLLRLPPPGFDETEWLTLDDMGAPTPTRQRGSLSLAAAAWRTGRVVVLAPATQILMAEPELPPGSGPRLARAVPFALEEQLTEDVDQLSFAIGKRRGNGVTPVAVVSRSVLLGWLDELQAAGFAPQAIYADIALMPENPSQTVLWLEKDRLAVKRPGRMAFAVELSPVQDALVIAGVIADPLAGTLDPLAEPKALESALLYVTRDDWLRVEAQFEHLVDQFASFKVQLLVDGPLPWLARGLDAADSVNLLQGEFARATDYGASARRWRTPALLAAGLLATYVTAQAVEIAHEKRTSAALDTEIAQVFTSAMPSDPIEEPRRQMQTRLERIHKSAGGPEYFLRTLQALSGALGESPKTTIDAFSFSKDSLDLKLSAPGLSDLSQVSQQVAKQGLSAEIQSSTPVAGGIEAHLQVRPQKSRTAR